MITVEKGDIEGFGSITGPLKYKVNRPGLNVIKGRVGSGKTSIIDAICWALYGQRSKNKASTETWDHIKGDEYIGTKVKVTFKKDGVEYKVIRCEEYKGKVNGSPGKNRLILMVGGIQTSQRGKREVQKEIQNIIGYSYDLFKSAVFFGQRVNRFMDESGPEKKKIMEEAFEISYISKANEVVTKKLAEASKEYQGLKAEFDNLTNQIRNEKNTIKNYDSAKAEFEKEKQKNLSASIECRDNLLKLINKDYSPQLKEVKSKKAELQKRIDKLTKRMDTRELEKDEFTQDLKVNSLMGNIETHESELKALKQSFFKIPKDCDKCGRPLNKKGIEFEKGRIKQQIEAFKNGIVFLKAELTKHKEQYQATLDAISSKQKLKSNKVHLETKFKKLDNLELKVVRAINHQILHQQTLEIYKKEIKRLTKSEFTMDINPNRRILSRCLAKKQPIARKLEPLEKQIKDLEWLKKDPLSNAGLKAFIFDSMLAKLNHELHKFHSILTFDIKMGINMGSANKDFYVTISRGGAPIPIEDLSGGQKQLTNFAIALSCNSVITGNKPINFLIMDECFEGLGDEEIETILRMLRPRASSQKSLHIITHRNFNPINSYITEVGLNAKGQTEILNKLKNS